MASDMGNMGLHQNKDKRSIIMERSFLRALRGIMLAVAIAGCTGEPAPAETPAAKPADELDVAIRETSNYLNKQLPKGNKLVILNIQSAYPALSEYIIDELIANTVNDRVFTVVDRQQLEVIRAELDFQVSGEVDDNTAQALGRMAGAQIIVSGAVSKIGDLYRLRIRALGVQTAQIEGQFNRNIPDGPTVAALVRSQATGYGDSSGRPAATAPVKTSAAQTGQAAAPAASGVPAQAQAQAPASAPAKEYKIGDTGPAGGIVFYDKGNSNDGWRYLEAAPVSTEISIQWGASGTDAGGKGVGVGTGKQNTQVIVDAMNELGVSVPAAQFCVNLDCGGFRDWFLPSKAELNLMYANLKMRGLGGFRTNNYWSSSERNVNYAWGQDFSNGVQDDLGKNGTARSVRAVRAF
jgi:hypothetical protein